MCMIVNKNHRQNIKEFRITSKTMLIDHVLVYGPQIPIIEFNFEAFYWLYTL